MPPFYSWKGAQLIQMSVRKNIQVYFMLPVHGMAKRLTKSQKGKAASFTL
ncbi:hypothetical protein RUMHYD_02746 [Blautia hydrogenotrophica DSM 10507]|uniref:Uncharacterized protein n=1 Tax=Blautia hydrogenotrophica (strain DSM 10507 / JCM 14656 / S5a33) TaxID=476272 RepID=C0CPE5_BLAHS|nr:hypothetical protein RUMHYD_02746 [Blautia hydrogenotrophica DSM 10507]